MVADTLGEPLQFGPWWDASVTVSRDAHVVTAQYVLRGTQASADLRVGVVKTADGDRHWTARSAALYTSPLGPQPGWTLMLCDVTLPGGARTSGLPADRVDLLARTPPEKATNP